VVRDDPRRAVRPDAAGCHGKVGTESLGCSGGAGGVPGAGTGFGVRQSADDLGAGVQAAGGAPITLSDVVAELDERASAQHAPTVQGVTLASLHAAKGLEWDAVFLVGLCEGLMPISLAEGWAAVEEERRLLYVGITRAREHLLLSWTRSRTPGGRGESAGVRHRHA